MPCNSDYQEPSGQELESTRVCGFICYLNKKVGKRTEHWIRKAAAEYYGNVNRLSEATKILCETLRSLKPHELEAYVHDIHVPTCRKLTAWWERHKEWDARRTAEEEAEKEKEKIRKAAMSKLNAKELDALGLIGGV